MKRTLEALAEKQEAVEKASRRLVSVILRGPLTPEVMVRLKDLQGALGDLDAEQTHSNDD